VKAMIDWMRCLLKMPKPWVAWVGLMGLLNMMVPFAFLGTREAQAAIGAIVVGMVIQTAIFARLGFVRLIGLGHILWIPLVVWFVYRLSQEAIDSPFEYWMAATVAVNSVSLVIDAVDVARFALGERVPTISLEEPSDG
jgi:hypothetical protein